MKCINCGSVRTQKDGNHKGYQRYKCFNCKKRFDYGKYEKVNEYIYHFHIKLKKKDENKLNRDNYCIPTNLASRKHYEVKLFSDEWVKKHYEDCMKNFDANMRFMSKLNHEDFNKYLMNLVEKYDFMETDDLRELTDMSGLYILVLDGYSQMYLGKSETSIKNRILEHWRKRKEFDRLIYGNVEGSILSVYAFGALDTTRIFFKELDSYDCDEYLEDMASDLKVEYSLNRVEIGFNNNNRPICRDLDI